MRSKSRYMAFSLLPDAMTLLISLTSASTSLVALASLSAIAETGVDDISVGELTKDVKAVDLSMRFA